MEGERTEAGVGPPPMATSLMGSQGRYLGEAQGPTPSWPQRALTPNAAGARSPPGEGEVLAAVEGGWRQLGRQLRWRR